MAEQLTAAELAERTDRSIGAALKEAFPHSVAAETSADDMGVIVDTFREIMAKHRIRLVDDRRDRMLIDERVYEGACSRAARLEALCRQHGIDPSISSATDKPTVLDQVIAEALEPPVRQDPEFVPKYDHSADGKTVRFANLHEAPPIGALPHANPVDGTYYAVDTDKVDPKDAG